MNKAKSLSEKRLIVEVEHEGKKLPMLIDTGASVALIDKHEAERNGIERGARYAGRLVGASGEFTAYHCKALFSIEGKMFGQFLIADLGNVKESVERETGVKIAGIISLPQMRTIGLSINTQTMEIYV